MKKVLALVLALAVFSSFMACNPDDDDPIVKGGKLTFKFLHQVDNMPLELDTVKYVNAAGNKYGVSDLQYFISDVTLTKTDGSKYVIDEEIDIYYIDFERQGTLEWDVFDIIPEGDYSGISFTFGISEEKNESFMYVNPPESDMFWPELLGGGYHYMKLNGRWFNDSTQLNSGFNFHLGVGQTYASNVIILDSITGFIHNDFDVTLPASAFSISVDEEKSIEIIMNINKWFEEPNIYDHNIWGASIMQTQAAMQMASENGHNVFSVGQIQ